MGQLCILVSCVMGQFCIWVRCVYGSGVMLLDRSLVPVHWICGVLPGLSLALN